MKLFQKFLFTACISAILFSCSNHSSHKEGTAGISAEAIPDADASVATDLKSPDRKIIKTADLKARVNNVYKATHELERNVNALNGLVTESFMQNQITGTRNLSYKIDSLRQVQSYTTTSHLTVRVPVKMIDSFMTAVVNHASFVDSRNLKLNDATLLYMSNDLKKKIADEDKTIDKANVLAKKSKDIVETVEYKNETAENNIARKIENLSILDQANFATIRIDLYQPERIDAVIIPNINYLMKPSFDNQLKKRLINSWEMMKILLIALANIWILLAIAAAVIIALRFKKNMLISLRQRPD